MSPNPHRNYLLVMKVGVTRSMFYDDVVVGITVGNLGDLHGISSKFPNDPCTSDC